MLIIHKVIIAHRVVIVTPQDPSPPWAWKCVVNILTGSAAPCKCPTVSGFRSSKQRGQANKAAASRQERPGNEVGTAS